MNIIKGMLIDLFDDETENPDDFVSFLVFEPASLRIPDNDILLIGDPVEELFKNVISSEHFNTTLPDQSLLIRLKRIEMMIDLLKSNNGLIMTKFLNNIWRRYSFFSNLGELFLTQKDLNRLVPNQTFNESLILDRYIETDDSDSEDSDSTDESDEEKQSEDDQDDSKKESQPVNTQ